MTLPNLRPWLPVVIGLIGAAAALAITPPGSHDLGPTTIELKATTGTGRTALDVTPFGTLTARTHRAPLDVTVALQRVDVEQLGNTITTAQGRRDLQTEIQGQIPNVLRRAAITYVLAALALAAIVGAAILPDRAKGAALAGASGAIFMAVVLAATALTYDQRRFKDASYSGSLARARQVIETLTQHADTLDQARSRYQVAARRAAELMVLLAHPQLDPAQDTTAILHLSDIHANPVGLEIAEQLAAEFGVAGVIDTGDLAASFLDTGELSALGGPLDRLTVQGIERLEVPYVFVPGNHDSPKLRSTIATATNATVLDGDSTSIADVEILGWGDPTYSTTPTPESEKSARRLEVADDVAAAVELEEPDVLAVHDAILGAEAAGAVPLVVSGHFHRRIVTESQGTIFLTVGSTGATGLKSLTVETDLRYEAEILYFEAGRLVAVDYVTLKGLGEDFVLERDTFAPESEAAEL